MNATASIVTKTRQRLADRNKLPRWLWYPADKPAPGAETWEAQFREVSDSIRRTMVMVIGYCFFCFLTLGQSFKDILEAGGIMIPFGGTTVSARTFLTIGPLILLGLMGYLHIFVGHWETLRRGRYPETLTPPYIFNLVNPFAALLSWLIFYLLSPVVLFWFAVKALATPSGWIISVLAALSTVVMLFLALRRSRGWKRFLLWLALPTMILFGGAWSGNAWSGAISELFTMDLRGAELQRVDLSGFNLSSGVLQSANLREADLHEAHLTKANLREANLHKADLRRVMLYGADLREADLRGADLREADLREADLHGADLLEADLRGAKLGDRWGIADLRGAKNLTREQLTQANKWENAYRDPELAFGEPIPQPPMTDDE